MAVPKFDRIGGFLPKGSQIDSLTIKAPEDPEDKLVRLRKEWWSFVAKEIIAWVVAFLVLVVIAGYCCFVVVRHGVVSPEARTVFPLLTTLFGGVVGPIIGKAAN